jgi:hypothetical protein
MDGTAANETMVKDDCGGTKRTKYHTMRVLLLYGAYNRARTRKRLVVLFSIFCSAAVPVNPQNYSLTKNYYYFIGDRATNHNDFFIGAHVRGYETTLSKDIKR